ncbi:MAG: B12-binding domain-containing radical SAM protein [Candidatus Omnitrophica bacterium]|nr:B12-binding domain-containing radical SAM protein [Candidatus Omnitrophota bacterium]
MKKIVLINPRKGWRPPVGLLYIAKYVQKAGYDVKVIEFIDERYNKRRNIKLWDEFYKFDPDYVGLGIISWNRRVAGDIVKQIRSTTSGKKIICGGKDPSYVPQKYLQFGADVAVVGEGEETIVELLNSLTYERELDFIKGIAFLRDGAMVTTSPREPISLDDSLFPAYELVDYEHYTNIKLGGIPGHFIKTGFMMANRGCPYKCTFCAETVRNVYRERPIANIVNEIKWQIEKYNIEGLVFLDDLFYFKDDRVIHFCESILSENIKLKIYAQTRVDRVGRKETLELMRKAGFIQLALGVESGSPSILERVNKKITIEQIKQGVKAINDAGIYTYSYLVIGLPYETEEDLKMTETLLSELHSTFVAVNYYMPMPGTPLYNEEDDKMLDEISYSLTENQTFRPQDEQKRLAYYRAKFQSMSERNPNFNLFRYSSFYGFILDVILFHPFVLLKGLSIQLKQKLYSSNFEAMRTAMINYRIYG